MNRPERLHVYLIYGLFGISPQRWTECLPWQTRVNGIENQAIDRYLRARTQS